MLEGALRMRDLFRICLCETVSRQVSAALQAAMSWQPLKQDATWNRGWSLSIDVYDYTAILLLHIYRLKIPLTRIICQLLSRGYSVSDPWRLVLQLPFQGSDEDHNAALWKDGFCRFLLAKRWSRDQRNANKRQVGECSMVRYRYSRGTLHPWDNEKR